MATIGQLLDRLEIQIRDLPWPSQDAANAHATGWMPLARAGWQAITLLPLGGRSDQVKAGIQNVLAPLAHGPRKPDDEASPAPQLVELATTVGAISDSLAGILRWGPRPEHVGAPSLELEADLLSALHVVARWSRTAVESQSALSPRPPLVTFLGDLIVVTEPYALIPPQRLASTLEDLAFVAPSISDLDGVTAGWAETAGGILSDHYRVSGWAMQTIAADLALICHASRAPFTESRSGRTVEGLESAGMSEALDRAAHLWKRAAAWPPHLRLGGQNPDLRAASRSLREVLASDPISSAAVSRRVLGHALPVGIAHADVMRALVRDRELWIHAPFLIPKVAYNPGWIREPPWSAEGRPLLVAAEAARLALDDALRIIADPRSPTSGQDGRAGRHARRPLLGHSHRAGYPSGLWVSGSAVRLLSEVCGRPTSAPRNAHETRPRVSASGVLMPREAGDGRPRSDSAVSPHRICVSLRAP